MKIATIALSSCSGCHMALVNLGLELVPALAAQELVFSPILMDAKSIGPCDLALVEGSVRTDEDLEKLNALREQAKTLVAFGTCACFGGIPGLGSAFATLDLLTQAYEQEFTPRNLPVLAPRVSPIDTHVLVDHYLPGCPPPPHLLRDTLNKLIAGQAPTRTDLPVCAECKRIAAREHQPDFVRTVDTVPKPNECLLSQGYVCLGSVSRGGCGAECPHTGVPCLGCRGPIDRVFVEPTHGILHDLARRISHYTGKTERQVQKQLPDLLHSLYMFTLSTPQLRRKGSEQVHALVNRIHL